MSIPEKGVSPVVSKNFAFLSNSTGSMDLNTNEVQNEVSNQNYKLDKLCSLIEKLFTLMVENNLRRPKIRKRGERKNDLCNPSSERTKRVAES